MNASLSISSYIVPFLSALVLSVFLTVAVRALARRAKIMDYPSVDSGRRIHTTPVPLLGGVAVFLSFSIILAAYTFFSHRILGGYVLPKYLIGITIGGLFIMIGGVLDDRFHLSAKKQIIWPALAAFTIIASGIGVTYIQNPFGGTIRLEQLSITLFSLNGLPYHLVIFADLFTFVWLMGMMYTTKFLDGLDGLVSGVTAIGSIVLFFLSLGREVAQPETALLTAILAGAALGFLFFNFHPAKVFLGEGGSLWTGFIFGTLAIMSGAKVATALLIFGIPILDVGWVIIRRLFQRKSVIQSDRQHLHFRLLDAGLSHRQAVLFLYLVTGAFGVAGLFFHGREKFISLLALFGLMLILGGVLVLAYKKRRDTT